MRPAAAEKHPVTAVPASPEGGRNAAEKGVGNRTEANDPRWNMSIATNYIRLREEIPDRVIIVVAAKTRSVEEVMEVIDAGATDIGENYVQEAERMRDRLAEKTKAIRWHMIGHLQMNKINKAIGVFDIVQTVDSMTKAVALSRRMEQLPREDIKAGIRPDEHEPFEPYIEQFVTEMAQLCHIRIEGLMTMGPRFGDAERSRPHFRRVRGLFERLAALERPGLQMRYLSMGMTDSYKVAIEEGANMVRLGTAIFGPRACSRL
jgi:pyridoxal phosphate enzyme (YggS family)